MTVYRGNSNFDSVTLSAILFFIKSFLAFSFVNLCFPAKLGVASLPWMSNFWTDWMIFSVFILYLFLLLLMLISNYGLFLKRFKCSVWRIQSHWFDVGWRCSRDHIQKANFDWNWTLKISNFVLNFCCPNIRWVLIWIKSSENETKRPLLNWWLNNLYNTLQSCTFGICFWDIQLAMLCL